MPFLTLLEPIIVTESHLSIWTFFANKTATLQSSADHSADSVVLVWLPSSFGLYQLLALAF
jgi:hypothetical protein